jgi:hypothetical protein
MAEPCFHEKRLEVIERRYDGLLESLKKMEDKFDAKLDMILFQINKVAVLEEKHTYQSAALERAFTKIEILDEAIDQLSSFKDKTEGMARMAWLLWSAMGVTIGGLVLKVFGAH